MTPTEKDYERADALLKVLGLHSTTRDRGVIAEAILAERKRCAKERDELLAFWLAMKKLMVWDERLLRWFVDPRDAAMLHSQASGAEARAFENFAAAIRKGA